MVRILERTIRWGHETPAKRGTSDAARTQQDDVATAQIFGQDLDDRGDLGMLLLWLLDRNETMGHCSRN
jgi:hypothetical protein